MKNYLQVQNKAELGNHVKYAKISTNSTVGLS